MKYDFRIYVGRINIEFVVIKLKKIHIKFYLLNFLLRVTKQFASFVKQL